MAQAIIIVLTHTLPPHGKRKFACGYFGIRCRLLTPYVFCKQYESIHNYIVYYLLMVLCDMLKNKNNVLCVKKMYCSFVLVMYVICLIAVFVFINFVCQVKVL